MKHKKLFLSVLCLACAFTSGLALFSCKNTSDVSTLKNTETLEYEKIVDREEYRVIGLGTVTSLEITIPETYNSLPVTEIGKKAFSSEECTHLTSISIPDTITKIADFAFSGCDNLNYNEKETLKYLGNETNPYLYLAKTTSTEITSITLADTCTLIADSIFNNCKNLINITVGESNKVYASQNGILYNKEKTNFIHIPANVTGEITIPEGVTKLEDSAFSSRKNITNITFPSTLTEIGTGAFTNCRGLTSFTVPTKVTSISENMLANCKNLTTVLLHDNVKNIGLGAFSGCSSLTTVNIPNGIKKIAAGTFGNCSSLLNIILPESVTYLGSGAFNNCTGLTSFTVPRNVDIMEDAVFAGCTNLINLTFDDTSTWYSITDRNALGADGARMYGTERDVTNPQNNATLFVSGAYSKYYWAKL